MNLQSQDYLGNDSINFTAQILWAGLGKKKHKEKRHGWGGGKGHVLSLASKARILIGNSKTFCKFFIWSVFGTNVMENKLFITLIVVI